jgi:hypothetical protein
MDFPQDIWLLRSIIMDAFVTECIKGLITFETDIGLYYVSTAKNTLSFLYL